MQTPSDAYTAHRGLLDLHRTVDESLDALVRDIGLVIQTESVAVVGIEDLEGLAAGFDPQTVMARLDAYPHEPILLVAEPALCNTVLTRIWRCERESDAALTQVEGAIVQQFLADVVARWRHAWAGNGIVGALPTLVAASTLSMLIDSATTDDWFVVRTVVLDPEEDEPVGVLLFCYPDVLVRPLISARDSIRWRARVERGLSPQDHALLARQVRRLNDLTIPAPVRMQTEVPLAYLNQLEPGDVVALDVAAGTPMSLRVLDRDIEAQLAQHDGRFALVVTGPEAANAHPGAGAQPAMAMPLEENTPLNPMMGDADSMSESSIDLPNF
jgi:flagellar motor switch/type III secretory pathway protein FliN